MNKEFLASTSVFAEMANNNIDLQKIINEFIINTYILNNTYSQNTSEIRSELIEHFDIDIPEAIVRTQLKRLKKDNVVEQIDSQFIINPKHRESRKYVNDDVNIKKDIQLEIFKNLSAYVILQKGPLINGDEKSLESSFVEYLFDNTVEDKYSTLISAFIVKNDHDTEFLKELNLIREGSTILKGIYYTSDFNDINVWKDKLTIYLDTEHLLSLSGLNGETFTLMLMDFYNLVRDINTKTKSKGDKLIKLQYTKNAKEEIEKLFYVAKLIIRGKAALQPGKTAVKKIVDGCSEPSDITRKVSEFFSSLRNMGITEADEIDLFENPEYNIVDKKAFIKYSTEKNEEQINKILEEFTYINILRNGKNNTGFDKIGHIIMTGDRVTRSMSFDNDLKIIGSDFSFATDVYYITQKLWFKLNRGLGFTSPLPSTLNVVNKARVIISSQINSSVRKRFNLLEREIAAGARTSEELEEYYLRLRSNTFSPENIISESLEGQIDFIYDDDDLENYLRNRSAEKSALKWRKQKVEELEAASKIKEEETREIQQKLIENSSKDANRIYGVYIISAKLSISSLIILIAFVGYIIKQETDSTLSVIVFAISGISLLSSLLSWKSIKIKLKKKAFKNHNELNNQ
ncbi:MULTISPECIES: hypothetical protein [unclassified Polaribacter]|uniref:hypothetical protein n=1 Tax=unclassified Polaribacter TaxID=196858 RepID=UPI0011BD853A|nr:MULTISPECIES: hypothetical protein [unclassified Polaribacter]TXD53637.1 hypothetical protein ES043_03165 [Polaribacter sp. IC063]TXD62123.1 hypothetical protein ES044_02540 [Polaribacter sp. IC066]